MSESDSRCPRIAQRDSDDCLNAGNRYDEVTLLSTDDGETAKAMGDVEVMTTRVGADVRTYHADAKVHLPHPMTSEQATSYFEIEEGKELLEMYKGVWGVKKPEITAKIRGGE